jgi:hypothetical protein
MKHLIRLEKSRWISLVATALIAVALAMAGAAGAAPSGTVTAVTGDASVGAQPAEVSDLVAEGESIVTGPDASCSVLLDQRALLQFCGEAAVRLRHDEDRNATIVDVTTGSTRTLAGPRLADEPLEIHTPVAIAAILGTILSATVDPATGDATFALEEGSARIQTRGSAFPRTIHLEAGQQVTIRADGSAEMVKPLKPRDLSTLPDCLDDRFFHAAAIEIARAERAQWLTDAITSADIPYTGLPPVAAPGDPLPGLPERAPDPNPNDPCGLNGICTGDIDLPKPQQPPTRVRGVSGERRRRQSSPCTGSNPAEVCE